MAIVVPAIISRVVDFLEVASGSHEVKFKIQDWMYNK